MAGRIPAQTTHNSADTPGRRRGFSHPLRHLPREQLTPLRSVASRRRP